MQQQASPPIHSQEWINDSRYLWWNSDYLDLLLKRIGFGNVKTILDCGIGAAHWSSVLVKKALHPLEVVGIDAEQHWVEQAEKNLKTIGGNHTISCVVSDVHALDLESNRFDLTTCQTLLLHCHTPEKALSEMVRVTKPQGHLLIAEPVNLFGRAQIYDAITFLDSTEQVHLLKLWSLYHHGQEKLTGNNHDIALRIPTILKNLGVTEIKVYQNDKVDLTKSAENSFEEMALEYAKPDVEKYVLAAGGTSQDIKNGLASFKQIAARSKEATGLSMTPMGNFIITGKKQ